MTEPKKRASYLSVSQAYTLNQTCTVLARAFGMRTYQVGSSLERADYRDVDLRCILDDHVFDRMFVSIGSASHHLMNVALSDWLAARTALPIDFQFQRRTEANDEFNGIRNAMGLTRRLGHEAQDD